MKKIRAGLYISLEGGHPVASSWPAATLELPSAHDNVRVYLVQTGAAQTHDTPSPRRENPE